MTYTVCTKITRADGLEYDAEIDFSVASYTPGYAATWTDPSEGDNYEFTIDDIRLLTDGDEPPITDAERAELVAWFNGPGEQDAYDAASGYAEDLRNERADWLRDQRMEML